MPRLMTVEKRTEIKQCTMYAAAKLFGLYLPDGVPIQTGKTETPRPIMTRHRTVSTASRRIAYENEL